MKRDNPMHAPSLTDTYQALVNYEAEQALLGACLSNNPTFWKVADVVSADDFADALHGRIFTAIRRQIEETGNANPLTLKVEFDADPALKPVGGAKYLARLVASVVTLYGCEGYAEVIRDLALRRRLLDLAEAMPATVSNLDTPADEIMASLAGDLHRVSGEGRKRGRTTREVAAAYVESRKNPPRISSTGIPILDARMAGGLWAGKLYGIGGRMKAGKSALLGTISFNLNEAGERHLYLALEASDVELEERNMARALGVPASRLRNPDPETEARMAQYAISVNDARTYVNAPGLTFDRLKAIVAGAVVHDGIRGVIVDYLQLVKGKRREDNQEQHLSDVAQWLADFAREANIWSLTAAQLNQDGNVRGSEGLKLAADQYWTLHREQGFRGAWMGMHLSRYTDVDDIGSPTEAGLVFHGNGLWFSDASELHPAERQALMPTPEEPAAQRWRR